jgi:hypothetical protein
MSPSADDEMRLLPGPEAKELAELHLLHHDLDHAVKAIRLLVDAFGEREFTEAEQIMRLGLYRDAVVQFVACFDGSAPLFLQVADIYSDDANASSSFHYLKTLRDTFAAHRNGPARQCAVGVIPGPTGPRGTGHLKMVLHVPDSNQLKHTHDFISKARQHVLQRLEILDQQLRAAAMAMSREEILALPSASTRNANPKEMRLSRERFGRTFRPSSAPK